MSKTTRRRRRLHVIQQGQCYYCPDKIAVLLTEKNGSVLEHFIPESMGGTYSQTVLACISCDKAKGMIPGPEFQKLIAAHWDGHQPFTMAMRVSIAQAAKKRNRELQEAHPARIKGEAKAKERAERWKLSLLTQKEPSI